LPPDPLPCPECSVPFRGALADHLRLKHDWSLSAIDSFTLSGKCRKAKAVPGPVANPQLLRRAAHA